MLTAAISCVYQKVGLVGKEITICQVLLKEFPRLRVVEDLQGQFFCFRKPGVVFLFYHMRIAVVHIRL